MQRRLLSLVLVLALPLIISSCLGNWCDDFRITGTANVTIAERGSPTLNDDIIRGPFSVRLNYMREVAAVQLSLQLLPSAYAFSCVEPSINVPQRSSVQIRSDRPFTLLGEEIPAGTDLIGLEGVEIHINDFSHSVFFSDTFIANTDLPFGEYTFSISAETPDGIELAGESSAVLEIE